MNWTDILACPTCTSGLIGGYRPVRFRCPACERFYHIRDGILLFDEPPDERREYFFEVARYDKIARDMPKSWGLDDTHPEVRASILRRMIGDAPRYLNIGQGFGQLEQTMPDKTKVCLDQSFEFLKRCQEKNIPDIWLVNGFAERMPFKSEVFPCVVSDSVFQTVVDQKEFLFENVRVLKQGGKLILTIAAKWNYPRKPQMFPASDPGLLKHFLKELGVEASTYECSFQSPEAFAEAGKTGREPPDLLVLEGFRTS